MEMSALVVKVNKQHRKKKEKEKSRKLLERLKNLH